jgi:hypothetical protein
VSAPKGSPFLYSDGKAPDWYRCSGCGAHGCKLWRGYNTFLDHLNLLCMSCEEDDADEPVALGRYSTDQVGHDVPAVPAEDGHTYWGYTSVPEAGVTWWKGLRTSPPSRKESLETAAAQFDRTILDALETADAWTHLGDARAAKATESAIVSVRALAVRCGLPLPDIRRLRELADKKAVDPMTDPKRFYILDTRQIVGNCALWWCPEGAGYTTQLEGAGLFSEEDAKSHRYTDVAVPEDLAKKCSVTHVRVERLRDEFHKAGIAWPAPEKRHGRR